MKTYNLIFAVILILGFAGAGKADTVQLDLSTLGMPTTFPSPQLYWQKNFDLGVTFSEISHVYINWSGGITAGLVQDYDPYFHPVGQPYPLGVAIYASFGLNPGLRRAEVWGGAGYPSPEPFNRQDEFVISGSTTWSDLLDGKGKITLGYTEYILYGAGYVQSGAIALDSATLVVDGTIVPEPASILMLGMGMLFVRCR